jgi:phosphoribosylformylglycinamidine synthase
VAATDPEAARAQVDEMCDRLLANPTIENYSIEIAA